MNNVEAKQYDRWTRAHQDEACKAGWGLFDYDGSGLLQLQKLDEADNFECDEDAINHVKTLAAQGNETARLAIELHNFFDPLIYPDETPSATM